MPAANSSPNSAYIALLRGINVGGHNKIPMDGLRELCTKLGFGDVQTYIQSGNVVFDADDWVVGQSEFLWSRFYRRP